MSLSAPYVAGSGEGQNVTSLDVDVTTAIPAGSSVIVAVTDGLGYAASVTEVSDAADTDWVTLYSQNEVDGDGSLFVFLGTPTDGLSVGDTITVDADQEWEEFQVEIVGLPGTAIESGDIDAIGSYDATPMTVSTTPEEASQVIGISTYQNNGDDGGGATTSGDLTTIIDDEKISQGTIVAYYNCEAYENVTWTVSPQLVSNGEGNPYGATVIIPLAITSLPSLFLDEHFGTSTLSGFAIRPIGENDEQVVGLAPGNVVTSGIVDEAFGDTSLGGGYPVITFTVNPDDAFGVAQVISGTLAQYYGPLPTPLIADAPYSQVYSGDGDDGLMQTESGVLVPKFQAVIKKLKTSNGSAGNMGGSRYRFVITDMLGNVQGEVQEASQKTITQLLDNMQTATFTIKVSNPMADYILNNPCLCKCYRQPVNRAYAYRLILTGDVTTDEEDTSDESGTLTFTVADPLNRLMYRLLGKEIDSANHGTGFASGTPANPKDVADVIGDMLLEINGDTSFGRAGVTLGIRGPNTPSTYIDPVYFTAFATQIALYTNTLDGVDFELEPQEPYSYARYPGQPGTNPYLTGGPDPSTPPQNIVRGTSVQDTILAKLNVYFPMGNFLQVEGPPGVYSKGRPYPVFEYGTGKRNVQSYQRIRNRATMSNRWWSLPDGFPSSNAANDPPIQSQTTVKTSEGTVAESITKYGGYEQVDSGDLGTGARDLRQMLVNAEASTTATPQEQITFVPTINCDEDWTIDYFLGDIATVRAYVAEANNGNGSWRFNGSMRLYGISGAIDDNEQEQITLTTINPNADTVSAPTTGDD